MASVVQVGLGFNGAKLCAVIRGSEFLTSLTVGLGAQINDADLEAVSRLCPHLQRLKLRFAMVSDTGASTSRRPCIIITKRVQFTANKSRFISATFGFNHGIYGSTLNPISNTTL